MLPVGFHPAILLLSQAAIKSPLETFELSGRQPYRTRLALDLHGIECRFPLAMTLNLENTLARVTGSAADIGLPITASSGDLVLSLL
jgi:hypothetical protein